MGPRGNVAVLTEIDCWELLRSQRLGRLSVVIAQGSGSATPAPEIFPVNYGVGEKAIVFVTAPGTKLSASLGRASFEIDGHNASTRMSWSVVAKGVLHEVTDAVDPRSQALQQLPIDPDAPGQRAHRMALSVKEISGRRFSTPRR